MDSLTITCSCKANSDTIDVENMDKLKGFSDYVPSLEGYKYTSYKTMKCYKLVFNFKYFIKNAGSIIVLIIIFGYIAFMVYFFVKDISPLKLYIANNFLHDEIDQKYAYPKLNTLNPLITYSEK